MRCLNCRLDGIPTGTENCPSCNANQPALIRDLLPSGTLLKNGEYKIDFPLGRGGFGVTYRAINVALEKPVAIKEFFPQESAWRNTSTGGFSIPSNKEEVFQRGLKRFIREGRILAAINHPNVVRVENLFEERNTAYLVMELISGQSMMVELHEAPGHRLPEERIREVMDQMVAALAAVHAQDIYHLDIKPDNVMVNRQGQCVLVDFGAAKQGLIPGSGSSRHFTLDYVAPEVFADKPVGTYSDIFELGMMLHEMLTGTRPPNAVQRLKEDPWKPDGLTDPWKRLLTEALRIDSEKRPSDVRKWWQADLDWRKKQTEARRLEEERKRKDLELQATRLQQSELDQKKREVEQRARQLERELKQMPVGTRKGWNILAGRGKAVAGTLAIIVLLTAGVFATRYYLARRNSEKQTPAIAQAIDPLVVDLGNGVKLEMVRIPGGEFTMGSPDNESGRYGDEGPQRKVYIREFLMGKYEVTQAQWKAIMGNNPSAYNWSDALPVEKVSWYEVKAFCDKLNERLGLTGRSDAFRLPSEAEWEYAARGGSAGRYSFGDDEGQLHHYAWFRDNSDYMMQAKQTHPVGQLRPNPYGLYDIYGNVWEWCEDSWHGNYNGAPTDGSAWLGAGSFRVIRGGGWYYVAVICRSAFRSFWSPGSRFGNLGFRLVRIGR